MVKYRKPDRPRCERPCCRALAVGEVPDYFPPDPDTTYSGTRALALCHDHGFEYEVLNPYAVKHFRRWEQ